MPEVSANNIKKEVSASAGSPAPIKEKAAKRSLKKNVKAVEFGAPAKPGSGYMRFLNETRPAVMEEMRKKLSGDQKLSLADIGTTCATKWKALSQEEKEKYNAVAKTEKAAFDVKYEEWKKTDGFKKFTKENAAHKQKQSVKKATDKAKNHTTNPMPSKGMSSYFLFATSPEIQQLVKETCAAQGKPNNVKEKSLIVKPKWDALGPEGQKAWAEKAQKAKAEYEEKIKVWNQTPEGKEYLKAMEKSKSDKDKALGKKKTNKRKSSGGKQASESKRQKKDDKNGAATETPAESVDDDEDADGDDDAEENEEEDEEGDEDEGEEEDAEE